VIGRPEPVSNVLRRRDGHAAFSVGRFPQITKRRRDVPDYSILWDIC